jgi:hypothetical protein
LAEGSVGIWDDPKNDARSYTGHNGVGEFGRRKIVRECGLVPTLLNSSLSPPLFDIGFAVTEFAQDLVAVLAKIGSE